MIKYDNNDTEQEEKSRRSFSLSLLVACSVKKFALGESFESSQSPTTNAAQGKSAPPTVISNFPAVDALSEWEPLAGFKPSLCTLRPCVPPNQK